MAGRVDAVDTARGVALVAMMATHVGPPWVGVDPPLGQALAGGRAAPLFAMLAGVALTLVHQRDPSGSGSARATAVRAVLLLALGVVLGSLPDMPVLVILPFYAVLVLVALPLRALPTRALVGLAAAWAVVSGVVVIGVQVVTEPVQAGQVQLDDLPHPGRLVAELAVFGSYPVLVWATYVMVGLVVGRLDLRSTAVAARLVGIGSALTVGTLALGLALVRSGAVDDPYGLGWRLLVAHRSYPFEPARWDELLLVGQHTSAPLNVVGATGSALLVVGGCALLVGLPWGRWVLQPLRAAGAMTLTLYTVHLLWTWRLVAGTDRLEPFGSHRLWLLQVVVLCAAAVVWRRRVGRGPLEALVRLLSVTVWPPRARKDAPV